MKSEPATPTGAPDIQLRQTQDELTELLLETPVCYISGVGVGGSYAVGDGLQGRVALHDLRVAPIMAPDNLSIGVLG